MELDNLEVVLEEVEEQKLWAVVQPAEHSMNLTALRRVPFLTQAV